MSKILDLIAFLLISTLMGALRLLPAALANFLAQLVLSLLFLCMPKLGKTAKRNLQLAFPEESEQWRLNILKKCKKVLARNIVRFAKIPDLSLDKAVESERIEEYRAQINELRSRQGEVGIIFATMHIGCFEESLQLFSLIDRPIAALARGFGLELVDRWWTARREYFGSEIFDRKGGFREVVERLGRGQDVAILCDQNVKRNHATFVEFFGHTTSATKTLALASMRTGSKIALTASVELPDGKIKGLLEEIDTSVDENLSSAEKVQIISQRIQSAIERTIRKYPEQWFWIHRRWKTQRSNDAENMYD